MPRIDAFHCETTKTTYVCAMTDAAGRITEHYEHHANAWDADRQNAAWNDKVWHDRFMAERGLQVTGVDSSPTMISLCRSRLPHHEWIVADMRGLSLGRRFDGILAWDSFFHLDFDNQRKMFSVFAEHAASRAVLMFNTGPMLGEGIGSYRGDPLYHASLAPAEYETLLGRHGFAVVEHVANDVRAGGRTVWLCVRRSDRELLPDHPARP